MEASDWPREGMNQPIAAASQSVPSPSACMDKLRYKLNVSFLGASHSDGITAAAFSGHI